MAELTLELADRRIGGVGPRRHGVRDRREVEVHTRRTKLLSPAVRLRLEIARRPRTLRQRGRDGIEAGSIERLDVTTFLVGREEEAHMMRRTPRRLRLEGVGDRPQRGDADRR